MDVQSIRTADFYPDRQTGRRSGDQGAIEGAERPIDVQLNVGPHSAMLPIALILLAFVCGSLPFSVWTGKVLVGLDVRQLGDGNPGATNVFRSGNKLAGLLALILDITKAAAPVGLAYYNLDVRGAPMFLIAIAPILGHAFSPFLGFKGGKALATALGVWIGLTVWKASLPAVVAVVVGNALFTPPGWSVMFALAGLLVALLVWLPFPLLLLVWLAETLILAWTHRADLRRRPHLRLWLSRLLRRAGD
jgi:glycerol-3-phosphate acyltransferase PlsY